jgi:hypothetical protein
VARVFISYAREDSASAWEVCRWLGETGHEVFLDRDQWNGIAVGDQWRRLYERCGGPTRWSGWSPQPRWRRVGASPK